MELASRFLDIYTLMLVAVWAAAVWAWVLRRAAPGAEQLLFMGLALLLMVFSATRYQTGYDWPAYEEFYVQGDNLSGKYEFEPGFRWLVELFRYWRLDFTTFQFVLSAAQVLFTALFIRKFFQGLALLALAVYYTVPDLYLINAFSLMRQGLALSLFLCGAAYFFERKPWLTCLFFASAMLFHISSAFAIGVFLVIRCIGVSPMVAVPVVGALAASYLANINILGGLIQLAATWPPLQKYAIYQGLDTPSASILYKLLFVTLFLTLFYLACYRRRMQLREGEYTQAQAFNFALACAAVSISLVFWAYPTFLSRFQAFFIFFLLGYTWPVFDFSKSLNRGLLCCVIFGVCAALYAKFVLTHISIVYFPYQSLFQRDIELRSTGSERVDELHKELQRLWRGADE